MDLKKKKKIVLDDGQENLSCIITNRLFFIGSFNYRNKCIFLLTVTKRRDQV